MFLDILLDATLDSIKLLPYLFITYLFMELLEHKMNSSMQEKLRKSGKVGPVIGGVLGVLPQCGFSAAAANLYAGRVITLGTMIAVFLSTSDEMLPIFLSEKVELSFIIKVLLAKVCIAIIFGFIVDVIFKKFNKVEEEIHIHEICEHDHCNCEKGPLSSAVNHTLKIFFFLFIINFILTGIMEFYGEEVLMQLANTNGVLTILVFGLIGMIPNCASSVIITQLYLENVLNIATLFAGLMANAGVGLVVLFRMNRKVKENCYIVGLVYCISVFTGLLIHFICNIR